MTNPPLDPRLATSAPTDPTLTAYDQQHLVTSCACLTLTAEGAMARGRSDRLAY